jgi:hypothetical protein
LCLSGGQRRASSLESRVRFARICFDERIARGHTLTLCDENPRDDASNLCTNLDRLA